ncbi:hypothetical protein QQ020_22370 [Fulvivirgaceae bacterium BMA12]|uniref:Uncharacterized protein n=1 Tax=Agaribacillus aureus TaxID=3051825 RepID=A0ABT8LAQ9_9BACT|nr:hypothetical protein [Fulvivirgaceae bacterium BMA12]
MKHIIYTSTRLKAAFFNGYLFASIAFYLGIGVLVFELIKNI